MAEQTVRVTPEVYFTKTFTLAQLKEQCSQRGIETTGKKADLAAKLSNFLSENQEDSLAEQAGITCDDVKKEIDDNDDNDDLKQDEEDEEESEAMETEAVEEDVKEEEEKEVIEEEGNMDTEEEEKEESKPEETEQKKTEAKKDSPAEPYFAPIGRSEFKKDQNLDIRKRSVVVGPIGPEEFARPEFETYAKETLNFFVRLNWDETHQKSWGHVEMRFTSPERALEVVEEFPKFREDLQVRRLGMAVNAEMVDREFKGIDVDKEDPDIRTLAAFNIPTDTKDEEIRSSFKEAKTVLIAKDEDGNFQGRVYLEFSSFEEADSHLMNVFDKKIEFGGKKTCFNRITTVPKSKRILDHFEHNKKGGDGQVLHPNKRENFAQRLHDFESKLREHTGNLSAAKRHHLETQVHYIKKRLAEDDELRKKRGIPAAVAPKINKSGGGQWAPRGRGNFVRGGRGGYGTRGHSHGPPGPYRGQGRMGPGPMHAPPHRPPPPRHQEGTTAKAMALINTLGNMLSTTMGTEGPGYSQGGTQGPPGRYGGGRGRDGYGPARGGYGGGYGGYENYNTGGYGGQGRGAKRMRTKSGNY